MRQNETVERSERSSISITQSQRILITGGAGFIGSHLAEALCADGHHVAIVDNFSTGKRENISSLPVTVYETDITNAAALRLVFADFCPDRVFHHAAQANVRHSINAAANDAHSNIIGSINVFEMSYSMNVQQVIFASSGGAIYGENETCSFYHEESVKRPLSPYGVSKLASELYGEYFSRLYNLNVTCLRYGNVYGPRQDPKGEAGVISLFLDRFQKKQSPIIFGTGEQVRDFIYISDVIAANRCAMHKPSNGVFNIGSGQTTSVSKLLTKLSKVWKAETGQCVVMSQNEPAIPGEVYWSALAVDKAQEVLCWAPKIELEDGLRQTVRWFIT